ncbi:hypothetical protein FRB97_002272 [Tulasnella sp. 331]|nr:hypothetical protein FRB97_002272 [Tulasnella sp. 331]
MAPSASHQRQNSLTIALGALRKYCCTSAPNRTKRANEQYTLPRVVSVHNIKFLMENTDSVRVRCPESPPVCGDCSTEDPDNEREPKDGNITPDAENSSSSITSSSDS